MNEALQALEIKVENGGATPQGKFFAKDWNTLVEAVKQLDLAELDEAALNKYLKDNGYITSDDIPSTDLSDLVTLSTEQTIPGPKNFAGGIKVNGQPLIYNAELGVWELTGDLLVTGNVAWFASIKGFKPSTIMDAVQVDGESIVINEFGQLKAIGGGSGGSGGGLTVSDLSNYLTTNKYTKQSDVETLISTALTPYALTAAIPTNNNQLSNGAGYITAAALNGYAKTTDIPSLTGYATEQWVTNKGYITTSALDGYATQSWVENKKYLTGITSSQVTTALGYTPYNSSNPDKYIKGINYDMVIAALGYTPYSTTNPMGYLTISSLLGYATEQWVGDNYQPIINSSNKLSYSLISGTPTKLSQFTDDIVAANYLSKKGGAIQTAGLADFAIYRTNGVYSVIHFYNTQDGNMTDVGYLGAASDGRPVYLDSGGSVFDLIHSNNIGSYNAGSATKLQTPRTIWGQSFDGTGNITHGFRSLYADSYNGGVAHSILNNQGSSYGLLTRIFGNGSVSLQAQREANDAECFNLLLNHLGGNVAIGGTTADAKVHVHGDAKIGGMLNITSNNTPAIVLTDSSRQESSIVFKGTGGNEWYVGRGVGNINDYFGIYNAHKGNALVIDNNSDVTIYGNLLVNGNVSWVSQSQRSLKHITSEQGLSLAQLERIKPIKFYWKDGRDAALHVGGVADVFDEVLPEVVARNKGILCLNYVDAAFYVGASLIAPVLDHERRITESERERETLKRENASLKRELAIMKQMLNQLPA